MTAKAKAKYKSDAFEAIHSAAIGLHRAGTIDKATMREFDESCLDHIPVFKATDIKRIREHAHVSQTIFARYLNTSESTVQKWETGQKQPSGMALKLLRVVQKHGLEVLA
jgi:putative transcriptional regulator